MWGRSGETSCDVGGTTALHLAGLLGEDWRWGVRDEHTMDDHSIIISAVDKLNPAVLIRNL